MYITRNEAEVTLGRAREFDATIDQLIGVLRLQPGYLGTTFLQSYGNPGRYTLTSRWTDRDASLASSRSEQFMAWARSFVTNNLARPLRLSEAYESVFEVDAENMQPSGSTCEMWIDWTLNGPRVAPAFEAYFRQISELNKQYAPGFVTSRLRRYLGNHTRYLALAIVTDLAAARARSQVPELNAFWDGHPYSEFAPAPPISEVYFVVQRYAPTSTAATQSAAATVR